LGELLSAWFFCTTFRFTPMIRFGTTIITRNFTTDGFNPNSNNTTFLFQCPLNILDYVGRWSFDEPSDATFAPPQLEKQ